MKGVETVAGSVEGDLNTDTQTSTLTVSGPREDAVYTCIVTSGEFDQSPASETLVSLNVYCK